MDPVDNQDTWWILTEWPFEVGFHDAGKILASNYTVNGNIWRYRGSPDWPSNNVLRKMSPESTTYSYKNGGDMVPVKKHKTDASIQPFRHYRPITGRPDDQEDSDFGLDIDPRDDPDVADADDQVEGDIWQF